MDHLNTHCGAPLVQIVVQRLGIGPGSLGKVKRRDILKTMTSRRQFLSDPAHRIRFVSLPKHSSWLNQIEIVFASINRHMMCRGNNAPC
ncbi:transposase [Gimesia aquarii]|uniref:Tc1-like transposase DDE domain-containing protein n=1 Tax=Gimesia aquarii TaxID=2527964 RepID=A0A517WRB2_9PLAN|nr:hypothetical protein V202x_11190 [Gimesia aquarii]